MTTKNIEKLHSRIDNWFLKTDEGVTVACANLEKFLGTLNFLSNMCHLGRTKIFFLLHEFLAAKDDKLKDIKLSRLAIDELNFWRHSNFAETGVPMTQLRCSVIFGSLSGSNF